MHFRHAFVESGLSLAYLVTLKYKKLHFFPYSHIFLSLPEILFHSEEIMLAFLLPAIQLPKFSVCSTITTTTCMPRKAYCVLWVFLSDCPAPFFQSCFQLGLIFLLLLCSLPIYFHFLPLPLLFSFVLFVFIIPTLSQQLIKKGKEKTSVEKMKTAELSVNFWCGAIAGQGHRTKIFPWITWKFQFVPTSPELCCFVVTSLTSECWLDWTQWKSHENALKITLVEDLRYAILGIESHSI